MLKILLSVPMLSIILLCSTSVVDAQDATKPITFDAKTAVADFVSTTDYQDIRRKIIEWSKGLNAEEKKQLVLELSARLMNTRTLNTTNYNDVWIRSRVYSKKMEFHGHGPMIIQDVFLENGRCAWGIEQILNCQLPEFSGEVNEKPEVLAETVRTSLMKIINAMKVPEKIKVTCVSSMIELSA